MHWNLDTSADANLVTCQASSPSGPLTFRTLFDAWRAERQIRTEWVDVLRSLPFSAYCWEVPPLTANDLDKPFQCVFVNSPALAAATPEPNPFREHFQAAKQAALLVAVFESLGRDALLVAPCPPSSSSSHTHIANFHRQAQAEQIDALWAAVGTAVQSRLSLTPLWLSTAGLGVHWLHVRLDSRPKYYRYRRYADPDFWRLWPAGSNPTV